MPLNESDIDVSKMLTITDAAADYVRSKRGVLTLRTSPRHGCCGGTVDLATADTEPPTNRQAYIQVEQRGLTVYVHRGLVRFNASPIRVDLDQLWLWTSFCIQSLYVQGAELHM